MESTMKRYVTGIGALALIGMSFAPLPVAFIQPAAAAPASQVDCEDDGGVYIKDGPNSICVYPEEKPGNLPDGYDGGALSQDTTTGHGNLSNKDVTTCSGNKGQCNKPD
jgi:hypothetical protein